MSNETTVPLLPCASIDDIVAFYTVLGFETTHRQRRPNPYAARILDSALARPQAGDDPVSQVDVLVYRAELALGLDDRDTATAMLARAAEVP